ncbi:DJ-1/PfpI family protein [Pseudorhizobium pelagicum]|uniref:Thiamine biosynthesis protein ThiJ n=1 Tax=Pseudorhizobium pelagicum TaxID=1509405 RepID=A0A922P291_9HYPH|nr:DJ-1/PfpI family protein [Pseudorhizobium pelagicum]KEQ05226.1 thiamine biosynthesis protein ThiJ [Pseudorhizobium pelagicum]KEQ07929.1 thiamine biosynthesis protein ThiJ [Pseudorhizobium pelagicum]|tara:strand:- start:1714 stop:2280 length:567 start_codon:yes stop_codon:yes gene_type:complete
MARIAIALTPDFADWECALLMAVARSYLGVEVVTASPDGGIVTSMGGLKVTPDISYAALDPADFDALVIPGGLSWEKGEAPDFTTHVHAFHGGGKLVAGICAAASALAATGVLNAVAHTGNSLGSHSKQPGYSGQAFYRDRPQAVSHDRVITAPGSSPVTFTMEILKALGLWGPQAEAEIAAFSREHR